MDQYQPVYQICSLEVEVILHIDGLLAADLLIREMLFPKHALDDIKVVLVIFKLLIDRIQVSCIPFVTFEANIFSLPNLWLRNI